MPGEKIELDPLVIARRASYELGYAAGLAAGAKARAGLVAALRTIADDPFCELVQASMIRAALAAAEEGHDASK